jgi:hypothetical protein
MEFSEKFWLDCDMWGYAGPKRGRFYMFWNLSNVNHKPIISVIVTGAEARSIEGEATGALTEVTTV